MFGRIYEYFLTQFADQKAHDGGEFFTPLAETSRNLVKQGDLLYKLGRLIEICENECNAHKSEAWQSRNVARARKAADEARQLAARQIKRCATSIARPAG